MTHSWKGRLAVGAAAALLIGGVGPAWAATFDPSTGTGFVGKGEVQSAFNWNDKDLQTNANGVTFEFVATTTYTALCTWETGKKTHIKEVTDTIGIDEVVDMAKRTNKKEHVNGFTLDGFDLETVTVGEMPKDGDSCDAEGRNDKGTLTIESETSSTGLYVLWGDYRVQLSY
jgi:hypothetical protein